MQVPAATGHVKPATAPMTFLHECAVVRNSSTCQVENCCFGLHSDGPDKKRGAH